MDTPTDSSPSTARLPGWLVEALDVLSARRRIVVATAVGIVLLGGIVALVAPSVLPPRAIVGGAVGIAAALLATAVALAMDASDLVVRGARHVRAAGGTVDVRVGRQHDDVGPLLAAVARHAADGRVRVALAPASRSAGVPGVRAAALAEALARTGRKVLLTDLTRSGTPAAGLSDVIAGTRSLAEVVRFEQELYLARLAVGSDPDAALRGFPGWVDSLPSDLEVLVAALPPLAERGVLPAAAALDVTLVLVEIDRTERVDLIASLDAVDASAVTSELVLVDPTRTPAPTSAPAEEPVEEPVEDADFTDEPTSESTPEVEPEPVLGSEHAIEDDLPVTADDPARVPDEDLLAELGLDTAPDDEPEGEPAAAEMPLIPPATPPYEYGAADDGAEPAVSEPAPVEEVREPVADGDAAADEDVDATAEISPVELAGDELAHIWDDTPTATPPAAPTAPAPTPTAATEPAPSEPASEPVEPIEAEEPIASDEPGAPDESVETAATAPAAPPAPEPAPSPEASEVERAPEPEPTPEPVREPQPAASAPEPAPRSAPSEPSPAPELDPAALEVARTSAALHQLAQQVWERDAR